MTEDHDTIRTLLADIISSRIPAERRAGVEEHLADCTSCREAVAELQDVRQQIRKGGEAMFEPHPEPAALRRFALESGPADLRVGRHLELCSTCRLEVETWKRRGGGERRAPEPARRRASPLWLGLAAVAGSLLGFFVALSTHPSIAPTNPAGPQEPGPGIAPSIASGGTLTPARPPVLHILPGMLRSGESTPQAWIVDPGEPSVGVAVPISIPVSAIDADRFRFELRSTGREPASTREIWSQEMTVARIREHLEASDVVNLVVVPSRPLEAGEYEFQVVPVAPPGGSPVYRTRIQIVYRQSPAATKAPQ